MSIEKACPWMGTCSRRCGEYGERSLDEFTKSPLTKSKIISHRGHRGPRTETTEKSGACSVFSVASFTRCDLCVKFLGRLRKSRSNEFGPPGHILPPRVEFTCAVAYNDIGAGQMHKPNTLGELKNSHFKSVSVKDEMRANLIRKLPSGSHLSRHCGLRRHRHPADCQRHSLPPQFHPAGTARPGQEPHSAHR